MRILHCFVLLVALGLHGCGSGGGEKADSSVDKGPSPDGTVAVIPLDELVNACIRASACGVKAYPILANCVDAYFDLHLRQGLGAIYDEIYRCVNSAGGDCDKVRSCFDERGACDNTYKATCDGTTAIACDLIDKKVYALKCATAGLECLVRSGQTTAAACTPGTCYSTFGTACQGSWLISCVASVSEVEDCAADGLICSSTGTNSAECMGEQSDGCNSKKYSPTCDGNTTVTCVQSKLHRDDCTRYKMRHTRCEGAKCVAAGTDCEHTFNRCAGAELEACFDGSWKRYDCAKLGLGPCELAGTTAGNCGKP